MTQATEDQPMPWWVYATQALSPEPLSEEELQAEWRKFMARSHVYIDPSSPVFGKDDLKLGAD